jgi:hypothetical protein
MNETERLAKDLYDGKIDSSCLNPSQYPMLEGAIDNHFKRLVDALVLAWKRDGVLAETAAFANK